MITVSTDMIFCAVVYSLVLGIVSATMYSAVRFLIAVIIFLFRRNFKHRGGVSEMVGVDSTVIDFLFVILTGISYLLLLYAFTDGVFFLCTLVSLALGFFGAGRIIRATYKRLFHRQ